MRCDFLIVGAGVSGAAAAWELAAYGATILVEAETAPGYHSSGRSAALFTPNYGNAVVRRVLRISHAFFASPPAGFAAHSLLSPRGALTVAAPGEEGALEPFLSQSSPGNEIVAMHAGDALALAPVLRLDRVAAAVYEPGVMDIDTAALLQGYLRGFKDRGGHLIAGKPVTALDRTAAGWRVRLGDAELEARVIVNAAGGWADEIGRLAGALPIGLTPKRRTALLVGSPPDMDVRTMPAVEFTSSTVYLKPESGRIMASLGDETPTEPQDAQPDEYDIAVLMDWLGRETRIEAERPSHTWAGLRSFVADGSPVVGFDGAVPDFVWLAGQGGYGIMMSPTLARACAGLVASGALPSDFTDAGLSEAELSPRRLR